MGITNGPREIVNGSSGLFLNLDFTTPRSFSRETIAASSPAGGSGGNYYNNEYVYDYANYGGILNASSYYIPRGMFMRCDTDDDNEFQGDPLIRDNHIEFVRGDYNHGDYSYINEADANIDFNFLHEGTTWTIEMWYYRFSRNTSSQYFCIFCTGIRPDRNGIAILDTGASRVGVEICNGQGANQDGDTANFYTSINSVSQNNWHHIVFAFDGSTKTCYKYVDGSLESSNTITTFNDSGYGTGNPDGTPVFGRAFRSDTAPGGVYYADMKLGLFRIYKDRLLNSTEVSKSFNVKRKIFGI